MADTRTTRERVLAAFAENDATFIIPTNDPLRIEKHWIVFDDEREKTAVVWLPVVLGKAMHAEGLLTPLDTTPSDRKAVASAIGGVRATPQANSGFLCRLSAKGIRQTML